MSAVQVSVHLDGQDEWRARLLGQQRACFACLDLGEVVTLMAADPDRLIRLADLLVAAAAELAGRREGAPGMSGGDVGVVV